jgi:hypothetical protein
MLMEFRLKVLLVQPPLKPGVVIDMEELTGISRDTASITFRLRSSKTIFSLALPPFCIKPSPVVGIGTFVQLQVVQFTSTFTALSLLPQFCDSIFCPDKIKYCLGWMMVFGGIVTEYVPLVTM